MKRIPTLLSRLRSMLQSTPTTPAKQRRLLAVLLAMLPLKKLSPALMEQISRLIRLLQLILELLPTPAPKIPAPAPENPDRMIDPMEMAPTESSPTEMAPAESGPAEMNPAGRSDSSRTGS